MKDFPIWYIIPKVIYSIIDAIQSGCIMYILISRYFCSTLSIKS